MNELDKGLFDQLVAAVCENKYSVVINICENYPKAAFFRRCDNMTPLHIGIMQGANSKMIKLLLKCHADPGIAENTTASIDIL
jgi:hypothetical protein